MNPRISILVAALAISTTGMAQTFDFGLQGGLTFPLGGMTDVVGSDPSLSLGGQMRIGLRGGSALVPRVDYVSFDGTDDSLIPPAKVKETLLSVGVDYNYYFSRQVGQGFYVGGGLGFLQKEEKYSAPAGYYFLPGEDPSQTKSRFYVATGIGAAINKHVNLFGRIQLFFDNQKGEYWNSRRGEYENSHDLSTVLTCGVEYHF
jgi:hypothetical protein